MSQLVDQYGKPLYTEAALQARLENDQEISFLRREIARLRLRAKYDAAQTVTSNEAHWSMADNLDPHAAASLEVRRVLRSRSRSEIIENNPYLKGVILTIANDFVGKGGPRLHILDERIPPARRKKIQDKFWEWSQVIKLRQKLWQMRVAKIVDGETFLRAYGNKNRIYPYPIQLDFQVIECDRVSSQHAAFIHRQNRYNEIDGIRFDNYDNPIEYYVLNAHPGGSTFLNSRIDQLDGQWIKSKFIIHWFRKDRTWLRGIPEAAPSLSLCALLRRYTLAIVRNAEIAADLTVLIESETPPGQTPWTSDGRLVLNSPFDTFPIEMGLICNLPAGYKAHQLESVPLGVQYDEFVGAILREITRPILAPFHIVAGTSKDSNMASAVVDAHIYKGGQEIERSHCEEDVLSKIFLLWWAEASRVPGYLEGSFSRELLQHPPAHEWKWDRVGLDHTDPSKVADAIKTLHDKRLLTDRDFQEGYMNRDVDDWRAEIAEDDKFRRGLEDSGMNVQPKQEERQSKSAERQLGMKNRLARQGRQNSPQRKQPARR